MDDVLIFAGGRTPVTGRSRAQTHLDSAGLASSVLQEFPVPAEMVMLASAVSPGGNPARVAALAAGYAKNWGPGIPGITLDAQCGGGLVAVGQAFQHAAVTGQVVVTGGTESSSNVTEDRWSGAGIAQASFTPEGMADPDMTWAADDVAARLGISRTRQEAFAVASHRRALQNQDWARREVVAGGDVVDDGPRAMSAAVAQRFSPIHSGSTRFDHTVTPVTAARVVDGAALVVMATHSRYEQLLDQGLIESSEFPVVAVRGYLLGAGDPEVPGIAPVKPIQGLLGQLRLSLDEIAVIEVVEAYAAQVLAVAQELGIDDADPRLNATGGALAYGHPWGASGAMAMLRAIRRLQWEKTGAYALVGCAIAGGMGAVMVVEKVN